MIELFLSELRRFRNAAAIYFAASLVLVTVLNQLVDIANAPRELHIVMLLLYCLVGAGLGAVPVRQLPPAQPLDLAAAPAAAPRAHPGRHRAGLLLLIVLAMALPLFIVLGLQDHFTQRVVDTRHYAGIVYLALSTVSAWLAGAYIMLHRSRWAFVILVLPILLTMHMASYGTMLALALACNLVLLFLVYTVFRPNRYTGDDAVATVASAAPLQLSFYIALLWGGSMLFQVGQMMVGVHPLSTDQRVAGGLVEAKRFDQPRKPCRLAWLVVPIRARPPGAPAWSKAAWPSRAGQRQYAVRDLVSTSGRIEFYDEHQNKLDLQPRPHAVQGPASPPRASTAGWLGAGGAGDPRPSIRSRRRWATTAATATSSTPTTCTR
jgi:hypothetical protein